MKVSICCVTYNHENFIAQALDSFLMQKGDFDFEIVIGEDCSTDGTRVILKKYEDQFPDKFQIFYNPTNLGIIPNYTQLLKACKGKYIAICDGDDYWSDPFKLKKQTEFLDNNANYSICFHNVNIIASNGKINEQHYPPEYDTTDIGLLSQGNYMASCSVVLRNIGSFNLPSSLRKCGIVDWPVYIQVAQTGKIKFLDEIMAVYREHSGGIFSSKNEIDKTKMSIISINAIIKDISPKKGIAGLKNKLAKSYIKLLVLHHNQSHSSLEKLKLLFEVIGNLTLFSSKDIRYILVFAVDIFIIRKSSSALE